MHLSLNNPKVNFRMNPPLAKHFLQVLAQSYLKLPIQEPSCVIYRQWTKTLRPRKCVSYLVEAFLAIILEVLWVDINLIFVNSVWTAILCWIINKFFHLHCRLWLRHHVERLDRDKGRCYTVLRNQKIRVCHWIWIF